MTFSTTIRVIICFVLSLSLFVAVSFASDSPAPFKQKGSTQTVLSLSRQAGSMLSSQNINEIKKQIQEHQLSLQKEKQSSNEHDGRRWNTTPETKSQGDKKYSTMSDISNFLIMRNVDMASGGYGGMRNVGSGTISTTTPVSGTILKAFLYWQGPTRSSDQEANASVNFNGTDVFGDNIGFSNDNCWGFENSQAYRAEVTNFVSTGTGPYSLSNFLKNEGNTNINGASIIVFFVDGDSSNNRDYVLFDGNDSNIENVYDALGWNVNLNNINYVTGNVSMLLHVSDGQVWLDDNLYLNSIAITDTNQIFEGKSVP
ncbi:MAG: hypothetical protein HYZ33_02405, partial [Ignavibacteriales bacterium]|nr:hypothetical protein [Ignavibacteriales bacterium]